MKPLAIVYSIYCPHIVISCVEQEDFARIYCSIKSLRSHSNIPVLVYALCKIDLSEYDFGPSKANIVKDFSDVNIILTENIGVDFAIERSLEQYEKVFYVVGNSIFNIDPQKYISELDSQILWENGGCSLTSNHSQEKEMIPKSFIRTDSNSSNIKHKYSGCLSEHPLEIYPIEKSECWISSDYWNCIIKSRIRSIPKTICDFCCRIID